MIREIVLTIAFIGLCFVCTNEANAADMEAILDEAAGASAFSVKDSGSVEQAHIDTDGNMILKGCLRLDASGVECTTAENLIVDGSIGIGDTTPASLLTVGNGDLFQVNSSGDMVKIKNVAYSWPSSQGGASTVLTNDSAGNLSWASSGAAGISADALDFDKFIDAMTIDAPTTIAATDTTTNALTLNVNSLTSGTGLSVASSATGLTTGTLFSAILSGSNAANAGSVIKSTVSGALSAAVPLMLTNNGTGLSLRVNDDGTDTDSTAVVVDASGNVGIGDISPASLLTVGNGDLFQVNSSGDMVKIKNLTYAWPAAHAAGVLTNDNAGNLTWASASPGANSLDFDKFVDAMTIDAATTLAFAGTTTVGLTLNTNSLTSGSAFSVASTAAGLTGDLVKVENSGNNAGVTGSALKVGLTGGSSSAGTALNVTNAGGASSLSFRVNDDGTYTDSTPFVVDAAGNVGIGTASPSTTLAVAGTLGTTGTISMTPTAGQTGSISMTDAGNGTYNMYIGVTGAARAIKFDDPIALQLNRIYFNGENDIHSLGYDSGLAAWTFKSDNTDVRFYSGGTAKTYIYSGSGGLLLNPTSGNVGIGDSTPDYKLDVEMASTTVAAFNRLTDDGTIISLQRDGVEIGDITASGGTVSYNAFTGSHYAWVDDIGRPQGPPLQTGLLCTLTGNNKHLHNDPNSEILYGIQISIKENDPQILGSYLALQESAKPEGPDNPHLVMAVGNGDLWVTETSGDIHIGDYLISSKVPGHAQKDPGTYETSYIVARAAENVIWADVGAGLVPAQKGGRHKKISVFFENFKLENVASLKKDNELLKKDNELFKRRLEILERSHNEK